MSDKRRSRGPSGGVVLSLLLIWLVVYFAVRFSLDARPAMPENTRLAISFIPAPLFAAFIWSFIRSVRDADELERRIHLETLRSACCSSPPSGWCNARWSSVFRTGATTTCGRCSRSSGSSGT